MSIKRIGFNVICGLTLVAAYHLFGIQITLVIIGSFMGGLLYDQIHKERL